MVPMRLTEVSVPATSRRTIIATSSESLRRPSRSAASISVLTRSDSKVGAARRDQLADVAPEQAPGRLPLGDERPVLGDRQGVEAPRHRRRPGDARGPLRLGNPQELADDSARQGFGQVRDDIHAAGRRREIEQRVGARLDARAERLHGTRRERSAHRVAQPRVVRRVTEQHRLPVAGLVAAGGVRETVARAGLARSRARAEVALEALAPEPRVAEDRCHVGVPCEHPEPVRRAVHRVLLAQLAVEAVGIGEACRHQALEEVDC